MANAPTVDRSLARGSLHCLVRCCWCPYASDTCSATTAPVPQKTGSDTDHADDNHRRDAGAADDEMNRKNDQHDENNPEEHAPRRDGRDNLSDRTQQLSDHATEWRLSI